MYSTVSTWRSTRLTVPSTGVPTLRCCWCCFRLFSVSFSTFPGKKSTVSFYRVLLLPSLSQAYMLVDFLRSVHFLMIVAHNPCYRVRVHVSSLRVSLCLQSNVNARSRLKELQDPTAQQDYQGKKRSCKGRDKANHCTILKTSNTAKVWVEERCDPSLQLDLVLGPRHIYANDLSLSLSRTFVSNHSLV